MSESGASYVELDESVLAGIAEVVGGSTLTPAGKAGIDALVERGLATRTDDGLTFSDELRLAFEPMATCVAHLVLVDSAGQPQDQFFFGEESSAAHALTSEQLVVRPLPLGEAPEALVACLQRLLLADAGGALPDEVNLEAIGVTLGLEGLRAVAWGGIVIARTATDGSDEPPPDWLVVVRCQEGFVWQYPEGAVLAYATGEEELTELAVGFLAGFL